MRNLIKIIVIEKLAHAFEIIVKYRSSSDKVVQTIEKKLEELITNLK